MKSLFAKILLWFWGMLAVTIIGSGVITAIMINSTEHQPPYSRSIEFELREARYAYETGGTAGLTAFLQRFHSIYPGPTMFTDTAGKDLLTGEDRQGLVQRAKESEPFRYPWKGRILTVRAAGDGKYWFFHLVARPSPITWLLWPQHLWMIGAAVLFCYLLAYHLTKPLRVLEKAVARFGQGDFAARARSTRSDELGQLARTFDQMAERIETLLAAERRLLGDISHELRSPLARLGVAVELARSGDNRESALNRIEKESERLNSLVGQLLQVTRAEGDPNSLRASPVRMDELVAELVHDSLIEASARGSSVVLEHSEPVTVEGDPELLRRAVENVIRNAIRYAPPGTTVEVSVRNTNGRCTVGVRDYGSGVPEESIDRIFDPFYRVQTDRDRASGGVGLGLAIARRAVALHKGRIVARNMYPGLMVELDLPAALHAAAKTKVPAEVHGQA